jgi:hypothetical protein
LSRTHYLRLPSPSSTFLRLPSPYQEGGIEITALALM